MLIIVSKYLIPKGYRGLTIFPFVFLKYKFDKNNTVLINHERIHIRQQLELLIVLFFVLYGLEFLIRFLILKDAKQAYKNISFEKEAYDNEENSNYLKNRNFYSFIKYCK